MHYQDQRAIMHVGKIICDLSVYAFAWLVVEQYHELIKVSGWYSFTPNGAKIQELLLIV